MSKYLLNPFIVIILLTITINAKEFVDEYNNPSYNTCIKNTYSTYDVVSCIENETKVQDKILNKNYKLAMKNLTAQRKKKLRSIQRLWIKYVDEKCSFFYHKHSGSGGLQDSGECILNETIKRAQELNELY